MKSKYAILLLVLILAPPVNPEPQQHAPTVEVCRADVALWYDHDMAAEYFHAEARHTSDNIKNPTPTAKLPVTEVGARTTEMVMCEAVDKQHFGDYSNAVNFYDAVLCNRFAGFILRHHLMEQVRREDAEGLR
jgi:hypothetical protein